MRIHQFRVAMVILSAAFPRMAASKQQMPDMPQEHAQHHHAEIPPLQAVYPHMGLAQEHPEGALFTLDQAQRIAGDSNPTLRQAQAEIRAAKAHQQQSGLYPNPSVGYTGDEIRGGSINGGKQGFFLEETIVTGGKLGKSREVYAQEIRIAEMETEEQKLRVESAVKTAFLRVLAAQELLEVRRELGRINQDYADTQRQLFNTGQADETEVLDAEVEAQRLRIAARMQENTLREEWRSLAAVIGRPDLPQATVSGDLERNWPELNEEQAVEQLAAQSPATRIADATATRAQAEIVRARSQIIPDVQLRGGLQYNNEPLGSAPHAIGWEGLAEVNVQLPLFNRNQGNVAAANAELDRAQLEKQRVALTLRERATSIVDQYANAKLMATAYRDELLPRATKAYTLMFQKYGLMLAAYPRVIQSQRKLFDLQAEYIAALENVWTTGIALQGFLLTDGLEAPARPGDIDRPVRETNVPSPERMMSPSDSMPRP